MQKIYKTESCRLNAKRNLCRGVEGNTSHWMDYIRLSLRLGPWRMDTISPDREKFAQRGEQGETITW